jgi:hypothetical protein
VSGDEAERAVEEALPSLESVRIGEWPGLGGDVELTLGRRHTILVGRNGAGKSLLIEGMWLGAWAPLRSTETERTPPRSFACVVGAGEAKIAYRYFAEEDASDEEVDEDSLEGDETSGDFVDESAYRWSERCWDPATDREHWRVEGARLFVAGEPPMPLAQGVGLFGLADTPQPQPACFGPLRRVLHGVRLVPTPRGDVARREVLVASKGTPGLRRWRRREMGRGPRLTQVLVSRWEHAPDQFAEFREVLRELQLAREVSVQIYKDGEAGGKEFAAVLFDGVNLGLQSDGTLRVAEILVTLLQPVSRVILIEEPETAVHPSLLARLLAVIDSYSLDRQIVVSTHAPQVVNWGRPEDLRLVVREDDRTVVRPLADADMKSVVQYLQDDGSLADFVYRRQQT